MRTRLLVCQGALLLALVPHPASAEIFGNGGPLCSVFTIGCPAQPSVPGSVAPPARQPALVDDDVDYRQTRSGGPVGGSRSQQE